MNELMKLEDALPLMEAAFEAGAPFSFFQRGTSMLPMLREGIDSVRLVSPSVRKPLKGEVALYRRKSGAFVLHRVIKVEKNGDLVTCGDNQVILEKGVLRDSVIAVLDGFYRAGEWVSADDKDYKMYVKRRMISRYVRYLRYMAGKIIKR
ncbi:MAG: hypothetical protein E7671_04155 [Ruminococcaceae bacterium]|nr:hypothetical protein [Oscillospiraceae bacterium]